MTVATLGLQQRCSTACSEMASANSNPNTYSWIQEASEKQIWL